MMKTIGVLTSGGDAPGMNAAIPLAIAHDAYYNQAPRGDLIIAVAGQPVSKAQEFNDVMRHYGPGDTVTFVVQRDNAHVNLSAQLEAEPQ